MRQHSVQPSHAFAQCGKVRYPVAQAAYIQLHVNPLVPPECSQRAVKPPQIQGYPLCMGITKLPLEVEV